MEVELGARARRHDDPDELALLHGRGRWMPPTGLPFLTVIRITIGVGLVTVTRRGDSQARRERPRARS